ncbi:MAG: alpha/beta hydrolase [Pseudomonas piscis]|uniref:alpha/beta hydrolase n=1 Tax=Pseudomonas piscis TaxID=2614538 RepID=UPI003D28D1A1
MTVFHDLSDLDTVFNDQDYTVTKLGAEPRRGNKFVILIHGRRQTPEDIYEIGRRIDLQNITYLLPSAPGKTWYPSGFQRELEQNQPHLDKALIHVNRLVQYLLERNVPANDIWLMGFSQGACIGSQYLFSSRERLGGALLFTGGLFGPEVSLVSDDSNCLASMPILLTGSTTDSWVPETRVRDTACLFRKLGADVQEEIFTERDHLVSEREIDIARNWLTQAA